MKYSPWPVQETAAQDPAKVPAAMIGVSPTRPGILLNTPAVEVAAASAPWASSTTQPTVPCARLPGGWLASPLPAWVKKVSGSVMEEKPWSLAKSAAPSPASMTCGVFSITARATRIGLA